MKKIGTLEEAESLIGNLNILHEYKKEAHIEFEKEISKLRNRLSSKMDKWDKQMSSNVGLLSEFIKERFISRSFDYTFESDREYLRLVEVTKVEVSSDTNTYGVRAKVLRGFSVIPGHEFLSDKQEPEEINYRFEVTLHGEVVSKELKELKDPGGVQFYTGLWDEPCTMREGLTQLRKRIQKFSNMTKDEKDPVIQKHHNKIKERLNYKLEWMISEGLRTYWGEPYS